MWHCANHRLELAVHDVRNEVQGLNNFQFFFDKLYSVYSLSPKNQIELRECASQLEDKFRSVGKVFSIRWVASSMRTLKSFCESYKPIVQHFIQASQDSKREAKECSKYHSLHKIMTSIEFLKNLGVVYDALVELSDLSLLLQRRKMTIPKADKRIQRTIRVMESLINSPGQYTEEAVCAAERKSFKDVKLQNNLKICVINQGQFYRSLAENLRQRLIINPIPASHLASSEKTSGTQKGIRLKSEELLNDLKIVSSKTWDKGI